MTPGSGTLGFSGELLVVTGMRAEVKCLPRGVRAICSGGSPQQLEAALRGALAPIAGVLSFGIAGGLDPSLATGDLVVPDVVRFQGVTWRTDADWTNALVRGCVQAGLKPRRGAVAGTSEIVASAAAKALLRARTDAVAVDMESQVAAAFAAERALPFAVLRAVADSADEEVPEAAAVGLRPDGRPNVPAVLARLARRPRDLRPLLQVARRTKDALSALRKAAAMPGEALAASQFG